MPIINMMLKLSPLIRHTYKGSIDASSEIQNELETLFSYIGTSLHGFRNTPGVNRVPLSYRTPLYFMKSLIKVSVSRLFSYGSLLITFQIA